MNKIKSFLTLFKLIRSIFFLEVIFGFFIASKFVVSGQDFIFLFKVFISFSLLIYPALYTINDIFDLNSDRKHPEKKKRPVASGAISIKQAIIFSIITLSLGLVTGYFISTTLFFMELAFIGINLFYSYCLKHIPYIEFLSNGITHPLRFYLGIVLTGGNGFILVTFSLFLVSTAFSTLKRENEIIKKQEMFRKTLKNYSINKLYFVYLLTFIFLCSCYFLVNNFSKLFVLAEILIFALFIGGYHSGMFVQKKMDSFLKF